MSDHWDIATHAANACIRAEQAYQVLDLWMGTIPHGDEHHAESARVGAVMVLLWDAIEQLKKAEAASNEAEKH